MPRKECKSNDIGVFVQILVSQRLVLVLCKEKLPIKISFDK